MPIKFVLARGGKPKPPFLVVQPGRGPQGLKGFAQAVAYLVRRWVITGVISGKITLVYPNNDLKYVPRFHAKAVAQWVRRAVMHEAQRHLAVIPSHSVELWKGHKVAVPPFAVTARVLLLADTCQREFQQWWDSFVALYEPERTEEALRREDALLRQAYWERWGDLPPKPEAEGPHFGTLEEHTGVYLLGVETPTDRQLRDLRLHRRAGSKAAPPCRTGLSSPVHGQGERRGSPPVGHFAGGPDRGPMGGPCGPP